MRHSLLAATLLLLTSASYADLAENLQRENCETSEVKALVGTTGNCRVIVAPKKVERQGACIGTFMGSLPCIVSFIAVKEGAAMNLTCGEDLSAPVIDQDMPAEVLGYNVATLIKTQSGQDIVKNDLNEYTMFSSHMVDVTLTDVIKEGVSSTTGSVLISLQGRLVPLTDVLCKN